MGGCIRKEAVKPACVEIGEKVVKKGPSFLVGMCGPEGRHRVDEEGGRLYQLVEQGG